MKSLGKIDTSSIKNQVYERCKKMIIEGDWLPGLKLPSENQLCEQLGVSRVSVRSALQSLEAQGFIDIRRGEGSFVCHYSLPDQLDRLMPLLSLDKRDILDVIEYRLITEPNIIPLVIEHASEEDYAGLENIILEMDKEKHNIRIFAKLDEKFHLRLIELISNSVLHKVYTVLLEVFNSSWMEVCEVLGVQDGLYYHTELLKAMRIGDSQKAKEIMYEHVYRTKQRMDEYYKKKQSL